MKPMSDEELQRWIERVSLQFFGVPFRHKASFNGRLSTTGGRYFTKSHNIEINPRQLETYGPEETEKIIKHELCHYHLHLAKRGYMHRDADFKSLLAQVGGSRYCRTLPGSKGRRTLPYRYKLICVSCAMEYPRKRKADPARYRCGKCSGKLKLTGMEASDKP